MTRKQRRNLLRILLSLCLLAVCVTLERTGLLARAGRAATPLAYLVPYLVGGWDVLRRAGAEVLPSAFPSTASIRSMSRT